MRLAVLSSHEGTTLQAVLDACEAGELNAQVAVVVSNNSASGAMQRAQSAGTATAHISSQTHPSEEARDTALLQVLHQAGVDWVLLLGYMKKLGSKTLTAYSGRIVNTHPALLPKFGGKGFFGTKVHAAVLASGETQTGVPVWLNRDWLRSDFKITTGFVEPHFFAGFSGGPKGVALPSILLQPIAVTSANLDVVIDAQWITREEVCRGVTGVAPPACRRHP